MNFSDECVCWLNRIKYANGEIMCWLSLLSKKIDGVMIFTKKITFENLAFPTGITKNWNVVTYNPVSPQSIIGIQNGLYLQNVEVITKRTNPEFSSWGLSFEIFAGVDTFHTFWDMLLWISRTSVFVDWIGWSMLTRKNNVLDVPSIQKIDGVLIFSKKVTYQKFGISNWH